MSSVGKNILVIEGNTYLDVILNIDTMTTNIRLNSSQKNDRYQVLDEF